MPKLDSEKLEKPSWITMVLGETGYEWFGLAFEIDIKSLTSYGLSEVLEFPMPDSLFELSSRFLDRSVFSLRVEIRFDHAPGVWRR